MTLPLTNAFLTFAITAAASFAADNTLGTWKLNLGRSTRAPIKSETMIREAVKGGVKVTTTGEGANGDPINFSYTAKYDGKGYPVIGIGAPFDSISIKQIDSNKLLEERKKTGGSFQATVPTLVSIDGSTLTSTASGTDSTGKAFSNTLIFEKQ